MRADRLSYDVRLEGDRLAAFAAAQDMPLRTPLLAGSYDRVAAPELFVPEGARAYAWQREVPNKTWADPFWRTFGLFRSAENALSCLAAPAPRGIGLHRFTLLWWPEDAAGGPDDEGPLGGMLWAMEGDRAIASDLPFTELGLDILDADGVSVLHLYEETPLRGASVTWPLRRDDLPGLRDAGALSGLTVVVEVARCAHPYWFPHPD